MELSLGWGNRHRSASEFQLRKSLPASTLAKESMEISPLPDVPVLMGPTGAAKYLTTLCIVMKVRSEKPVSAELIPALLGFPLGWSWTYQLSPEGKCVFSSSIWWGPSGAKGKGWQPPAVSALHRLR